MPASLVRRTASRPPPSAGTAPAAGRRRRLPPRAPRNRHEMSDDPQFMYVAEGRRPARRRQTRRAAYLRASGGVARPPSRRRHTCTTPSRCGRSATGRCSNSTRLGRTRAPDATDEPSCFLWAGSERAHAGALRRGRQHLVQMHDEKFCCGRRRPRQQCASIPMVIHARGRRGSTSRTNLSRPNAAALPPRSASTYARRRAIRSGLAFHRDTRSRPQFRSTCSAVAHQARRRRRARRAAAAARHHRAAQPPRAGAPP